MTTLRYRKPQYVVKKTKLKIRRCLFINKPHEKIVSIVSFVSSFMKEPLSKFFFTRNTGVPKILNYIEYV